MRRRRGSSRPSQAPQPIALLLPAAGRPSEPPERGDHIDRRSISAVR